MKYGESLTLKEAAQFAGVSEGTMRTWAKQLENIQRLPTGGYQIPRATLQSFLAARPVKGATAVNAPSGTGVGAGDKQSPLEAQLRAENERLLRELSKREVELQGVREELKEANSEVRKREAELRAYLSGNSLTGALTRLFSKK